MKEYSQTHVVFEQRRMVQLDGRHPGILSENVNRPLFLSPNRELQKPREEKCQKRLPRKYTKSVYYHCILLPHDSQIIILNQFQSTLAAL